MGVFLSPSAMSHDIQPLLSDPSPQQQQQQQAPPQYAPPPQSPNSYQGGYQNAPAAVPSMTPTVFPESPIRMQCSFCNKSIVTRTNPKSGALTFVLAAGLCLIGFWCCAWIPLVIDAGKDVEHVCPACNNLLGIRKQF